MARLKLEHTRPIPKRSKMSKRKKKAQIAKRSRNQKKELFR